MVNHTRSVRVGSQKATVVLETHDALNKEQLEKFDKAMKSLSELLSYAE